MTTRVVELDLATGLPTVTAQPFIVNMFKPSRTLNSELLVYLLAVIDFRLPQNLTGSRATARVAALASTTFTIKKTGVSVGSFNFAPAATVATFTFAAAVDFTGGIDDLTVEGPASPDLNLQDISLALKGTRL